MTAETRAEPLSVFFCVLFCDWCESLVTLDDEGMVVRHVDPENDADCPGSHGDDTHEHMAGGLHPVSLDELSRTPEQILDGVTDRASALAHLGALAREHERWEDHGLVPVPLGWLRALNGET